MTQVWKIKIEHAVEFREIFEYVFWNGMPTEIRPV